MNYSGFEITRRGSSWYATRRTRTSIWRLVPQKTLREIQATIDLHWVETPFGDW